MPAVPVPRRFISSPVGSRKSSPAATAAELLRLTVPFKRTVRSPRPLALPAAVNNRSLPTSPFDWR